MQVFTHGSFLLRVVTHLAYLNGCQITASVLSLVWVVRFPPSLEKRISNGSGDAAKLPKGKKCRDMCCEVITMQGICFIHPASEMLAYLHTRPD